MLRLDPNEIFYLDLTPDDLRSIIREMRKYENLIFLKLVALERNNKHALDKLRNEFQKFPENERWVE